MKRSLSLPVPWLPPDSRPGRFLLAPADEVQRRFFIRGKQGIIAAAVVIFAAAFWPFLLSGNRQLWGLA